MTKHEAVKAYFEPKIEELAGTILSFNSSTESPVSFSLITEYSDKVVKKYVTGDAQKQYGFTILITKEYSADGDDLNMRAMNFAQAFMDWLEGQNQKREFPDFGKLCEVEKMENLQNMPNLAWVSKDGTAAGYMIQCRILYKERKVWA